MHGAGPAAFHIGNDGGMPVALPGANPSGEQSELESVSSNERMIVIVIV